MRCLVASSSSSVFRSSIPRSSSYRSFHSASTPRTTDGASPPSAVSGGGALHPPLSPRTRVDDSAGSGGAGQSNAGSDARGGGPRAGRIVKVLVAASVRRPRRRRRVPLGHGGARLLRYAPKNPSAPVTFERVWTEESQPGRAQPRHGEPVPHPPSRPRPPRVSRVDPAPAPRPTRALARDRRRVRHREGRRGARVGIRGRQEARRGVQGGGHPGAQPPGGEAPAGRWEWTLNWDPVVYDEVNAAPLTAPTKAELDAAGCVIGSCPRTPSDVDRLIDEGGVEAIICLQCELCHGALMIDWEPIGARALSAACPSYASPSGTSTASTRPRCSRRCARQNQIQTQILPLLRSAS